MTLLHLISSFLCILSLLDPYVYAFIESADFNFIFLSSAALNAI